MITLPQTEKYLAYIAAVKTGSSDADQLGELWYQERKELLDSMRETVMGSKTEMYREKETMTLPRGEKKKRYNELIALYRQCLLLAKEISETKKILRQFK